MLGSTFDPEQTKRFPFEDDRIMFTFQGAAAALEAKDFFIEQERWGEAG
jgi:hypothetical protein